MQSGGKINCERLKEARLFRKMTMADLAQIVGINKQAISQFENCKTSPEPMTLRKIAEALKFPYPFFLETDLPSTIGNTYFGHCIQAKRKIWLRRRLRQNTLLRYILYCL